MNAKDLRYFKIVGQLHASITSSKNFNDAVIASLKVVLANSVADYAVIWRADNSETPVLRPMYWICPIDLSAYSCHAKEGLVGRVFASQKSETVFACKDDPENAWLNDFSGETSAPFLGETKGNTKN